MSWPYKLVELLPIDQFVDYFSTFDYVCAQQ